MGTSRRIKYYKELHDLDWSLAQQQLRDYCLGHEKYQDVASPTNWWEVYPHPDHEFLDKVPALVELFPDDKIRSCDFFRCQRPVSSIHTDGSYEIHQARINIPLINCEFSETRYYSTKSEPKHIAYNQHGSYRTAEAESFQEDECELQDSFTLKVPTIIRVDVPHNVVVNGWRFPRIAATIGFETDPVSKM